MKRHPPKSEQACFIGKKSQGGNPNLYVIEGGSRCIHCEVSFSFEETYKILCWNREAGLKHGLPRCPYCSLSLRTRSRTSYISKFWEKVKEIEAKQ